MDTLSLSLFGSIQVSINGIDLANLRSKKALALLIYLAIENNHVHPREVLTTLLWPNTIRQSAQTNLRQTISLLRKAVSAATAASSQPLASLLLSDRQTVQINPQFHLDIDVDTFDSLTKAAASQSELEQSVDLYRDHFLADFYLPDCNEFEEWVANKRAIYQRQVLAVYDRILNEYEKSKKYDKVLHFGWRQLALDEFREPTYRKIMKALAKTGRRREAISCYKLFSTRIQEELGIRPSQETHALYHRIEEDHIRQTQRGRAPIESASPATAVYNLGSSPLPPSSEAIPASAPIDETAPKAPAPLAPTAPLTYIETPAASPNERKRQLILLDKVENAWVKGILEQLSQLNITKDLLRPSRQKYNQAVNTPWSGIIESFSEKQTIPQEKSIFDLFFEADRSLLILGEPGAGKTTMLIRLAAQMIDLARQDAQQPIPVVLNLSNWAETQIPLFEWIVNELSAKYQIPRRVGRGWQKKHNLLLLLDGLDEMPRSDQPNCVAAINKYREMYGLTGVVVCSRLSDYETYPLKLNLGGAILIEPLTTGQVDAYLQAGGDHFATLRNVINADPTLLQMARSPLMLSIMQMAYGAGDSSFLTELTVDQGLETAVRRKHLFNTYIQRMLKRREGDTKYSDQQIQKWLSWLAFNMTQHNQTIFLGEQLQPSWLPTRAYQWLYILISRIVMGIFTGIYLWAFHMLAVLNIPTYQSNFVDLVRSWLPLPPLLIIVSLFIIVGALVGLLDGAIFDRRTNQENEARLEQREGWLHRGRIFILIFGLCTIFFTLFDSFQQALFIGIIAAINFVLGFDYIDQSQSWRTEVRVVGSINWSWSSALKGLIPGTIFGLILGWAIGSQFGLNLGIINFIYFSSIFFLFFGMRRKAVSTSNKPNEGILLSLRNFLVALPIFSLYLGAFIWITLDSRSVIFGVINGAIIALLFGGADMLKHFSIRVTLWAIQLLPWRLFEFLNNAVQYVFLRQVGGGYVFTHRFLQLHFADQYKVHHPEKSEARLNPMDIEFDPYQTTRSRSSAKGAADSAAQSIIAERFVLEEMIGAGSMGEVFRGYDIKTQAPVAIKQLRAYLALEYPKAIDRFVQEGRVLRQLNHPNILEIIATHQQDDHYYIITEFMPHGSLRTLLKEHSPLPIEQIVAMALEISDALARAHHLDIIHRDIKPANILLTKTGVPKLADFGEAYFGRSGQNLTGKGSFLGTPLYASPEVCEGKPVDERSDIWSFGIVLYEMVTGRPPFVNKHPMTMFLQIVNDPVPPISDFRKDVPLALEALIYRLLEKDPDQRPGSMRLVGATLEQIRKEKMVG